MLGVVHVVSLLRMPSYCQPTASFFFVKSTSRLWSRKKPRRTHPRVRSERSGRGSAGSRSTTPCPSLSGWSQWVRAKCRQSSHLLIVKKFLTAYPLERSCQFPCFPIVDSVQVYESCDTDTLNTAEYPAIPLTTKKRGEKSHLQRLNRYGVLHYPFYVVRNKMLEDVSRDLSERSYEVRGVVEELFYNLLEKIFFHVLFPRERTIRTCAWKRRAVC